MTIKPRAPTARQLIRSFRNQTLGWQKAIGELIDNACGNGATTVHVQLSKSSVTVTDDGVGCTEEKFAALASIGWHEEDPLVVNPTSKYGIGAKHAFLWAGGPTRIYSRRADLTLYTEVDWDSFGDEFTYDEPLTGIHAERECKSVKLTHDGVHIAIPQCTRSMNRKIFGDLHKALNANHWAAVEAGVIVRVEFRMPGTRKLCGGVLPGKPLPEMQEQTAIDRQCQLADGRTIRLVGGVLAAGVPWSSPGFEYIFGHRVVINACGLGAGGMSFERLYVRVFLLGGKDAWDVATNKNGLHDADEAALQEVVFRECESLLEASEQEAIATRSDEAFLAGIGDALTAGNRRKAKRPGAGGEQGTVEPKATGRQHRRAEQVSDKAGNCESKSRSHPSIDVRPADFEKEREHLVGEAKTRDRIVRLNRKHPAVAEILSSRNGLATLALADALWSDASLRFDDDGQRRLIEKMSFVEKLSAMLKAIPEQEAVS